MIEDVQEVIRGCLSGSEGAWRLFFAEYAPIAMNILTRRLRTLTLDEKEDIVQNAFSKLLKGGLKNFRGSGLYEFLAYFRRIVMNEALSYLRSEKERDDGTYPATENERHRQESWPLEVRDGNPESYGGASRDQLRIVEMVLEGSPVEAKQVVLMKIEGYKDKEIADILGISPGTVASRYARIKERAKKLLEETPTR